MAANGPLPIHLTFLTTLPSHLPGTKVRFLGCVSAYNIQSGVLEIRHAYPSSVSNVRAMVDVTVIVETMERQNLEVGAWINVVGYVRGRRRLDVEAVESIEVQAVMVWGAGSVKLREYEKALQGRLDIESEKDARSVRLNWE